MRRLSIRWQLTLWYGGVLAAVLCLFSAVVYLVMRQQMLQRIDQGLQEELADVLYEIHRAADEATLLGWLDRRFSRHEGFDFQITRNRGERFFVNQRLLKKTLPVTRTGADEKTVLLESLSVAGEGCWRIVSVRARGPNDVLQVQVARSLISFDQQTSELLHTFLLTGPLTLLAAVSGGYFLARRALTPVFKMAQTANAITADRLSQRIDVVNPDDELGSLAGTLNRMIERLEESFAEMRRFTADAAHELRTPLAVIRNEAEVALRTTRTPADYKNVLEELLEETIRLSNLADQLLFLSRQDAGIQPAKREIVTVDALLHGVVVNMQVLADAKGVSLALLPGCAVDIAGDSAQLRRVFYNLLDNAIKYTAPGGSVSVHSGADHTGVTVSIADNGAGIAIEHLPHIFERFYRVDPARSDTGAGLGLAICKSILKSSGGSIEVASAVGRGTSVTVFLPV